MEPRPTDGASHAADVDAAEANVAPTRSRSPLSRAILTLADGTLPATPALAPVVLPAARCRSFSAVVRGIRAQLEEPLA